MEMIKAAGLKKYYVTDNYEVHALDGVSLSVEEGEFLAIIGTSGSGKTTLLQILGGLDEPTAGGVWIRGNSLKDMTEDERTIFRRRNIGFVFQQYNLIPVINVYENIVLPLRLDGAEIDEKLLEDIVRTLKIGEKLENLPEELSGGQQQRVAIARALMVKPAVLLCDEPTGNLDSVTSMEVISLLKTCAARFHQTVIVVTHQEAIAQMADRILRVEDGKLYNAECNEMNGFTPNNNTNVIRLLSEAIRKCNKSRNRILMGAVVLCILTLTFVFGTAYGKINAEYTKNIRMDGTTASTYIEEGTKQQYEKARSLGYVRETGRRMKMGEATESGKKESICSIQVLDQTAWEKMMKPAYTGVHGTYPKKQQEIMLPVKTLKKLGIDNPKRGMKIALDISISFFQTEKEEFKLSGWYSAYTEDNGRSKAIGYVSEKKLKDWGYDIEEGSDILICQSNAMDWKDTEEKLYEDVPMKDNSQQIIATDTAKNRAVKEMTGSYGMAVVEAVVIICGIFLLVYNVMQISMSGDIRQMALLHTIGTTKKQIRKIYIRQIMRTIVPGCITGTVLSVLLLRYLIPELVGRQYLNGYGGAEELQIFRMEILLLSVAFTLLVILGASEQVIRQTVNRTCIEGMHYTEQTGRKKRHRRRTDLGKGTFNKKKRSETQELCFMAWKNVTRYRQRFVITVISMFLGIEMFLIVMVITTGSDYANIINQRPDFLIAGEFSEFAQKEGSGTEYQTQSPDQDPLKSEGDSFELLYDNEYDEFSPISEKVRNRLWNLDGVKKKKSYITEGAYMLSSISRDGVRPLEKDTYLGKNVEYAEESSTDYESGAKMIEGLDADTVQIVSENELKALKTYVEKNKLKVDMDSLENGTGVMIIHDHKLSQKQGR